MRTIKQPLLASPRHREAAIAQLRRENENVESFTQPAQYAHFAVADTPTVRSAERAAFSGGIRLIGLLVPIALLVGLPGCLALWIALRIARYFAARRRRARAARHQA